MSPGASRTVLVLDDEPDARELVRLVLEPAGYQVYDVESGEDGLALLRANDISVALVDLLMPGMSGREFVRQMASLPEKRRPVCVETTARRAREVEGELEDLDIFDILTKPFELKDLERRIALAWEEKSRRHP